MGIAIVSSSLQLMPVRNVIYRPLVEVPPTELALVWRRSDRSQITKAFFNFHRRPIGEG